MRGLLLSLLLLLLVPGPCLHAGGNPKDFPPLTEDLWALTDKDGKGALIVHEGFQIEDRAVSHSLRIRVFSEAGKAAAQLPRLPNGTFQLEGRTIRRDGQVTPINSEKDLITQFVVGNSRTDVNRKVLFPPGLSSDCVVDLRWKEPRWYFDRFASTRHPMETFNWWAPFPIRKLEIEISNSFRWKWHLYPAAFQGPILRERDKDWERLTFGDIPASEFVPFALVPSQSLVRLDVFPGNADLKPYYEKTPQEFWGAVAKLIFQEQLRDLKKGSAYRKFSESLRKGLRGESLDVAAELLGRLQTAIKNTSSLTFAERAALPGGKIDWNLDPGDLDGSVEHSATNDLGMFYLGYRLLRDQGLKVKIALVADRDQRLLDPAYKNHRQVTGQILGVESPEGECVWFEPSRRFAPPGLLSSAFQGTKAVIMDCSDWSVTIRGLGTHSAEVSRSTFTYAIQVGDEKDRFRLDASFSGIPEYEERRQYARLDPQDQSKALRESWDQASNSVQISKAEVSHAATTEKRLTWTVEGSKDREPGGRMEIHPFPLLRWPLAIPSKWPLARRAPIVLPYPKIHLAESTLKLPKGCKAFPEAGLSQKNVFGAVEWSMVPRELPDGQEVKVRLRVEISQSIAPAVQYAALHEFIRWIEDACARTVVVERPS